MTPDLTVSRKLNPGDRVAVLSPSFAAPGRFPQVHEVAATARRDRPGACRIPDHQAAGRFARGPGDRRDGSVRRSRDRSGHLGRPGGLHPISAQSLRAALFNGGDLSLRPVEAFTEDEVEWADPRRWVTDVPTRPSPGWLWHQAHRVVTAPTWGGNLEIVHWNLAASRWIRPVEDYAGCILLLETSQEMPSATEVFRMLRNAGERGLLSQFPAVVVGTAKAATRAQRTSSDERARYRADQQGAVLRSFAFYNPDAMMVFGVDIGHTDPQWVIPYGGTLTIDGPGRRITAHYSPGPVHASHSP